MFGYYSKRKLDKLKSIDFVVMERRLPFRVVVDYDIGCVRIVPSKSLMSYFITSSANGFFNIYVRPIDDIDN